MAVEGLARDLSQCVLPASQVVFRIPVNPSADELGGDHQGIHMFLVTVSILQRLFSSS